VSARRLRGGCHCGAIRVVLRTEAERLEARACVCAFCRKHGARTVTDPRGRARLLVRDEGALRAYRFARRSADFVVCGACGVYLGARLESASGARMTVNVNALDHEGVVADGATAVDYGDESDAARLARRMASWTPSDTLVVARVRADAPDARTLLTAYLDLLRARVPGFDPAIGPTANADEMVPPRGAFVVLREEGRAIACGGVKRHDETDATTGEIKRMYVTPEARGRDVGRDLLEALEDEARGLGMTRAILDTMVPAAATAAALYRSAGYVDVPAFNENPFANVWMAKGLAVRPPLTPASASSRSSAPRGG
jgi:GNAT superfamily N-acetyltransferase